MNDILNVKIASLDYIMHDDEPDYDYMEVLCHADDFFEHYGIKGMHWGIRRTLEELGYKISESRRKRKERKLKERKKNVKLKMKELEVKEQEAAYKRQKTALKRIDEPDTISDLDKRGKGITSNIDINSILKSKNRAQKLSRKMTSLSNDEIDEINTRLSKEDTLHKNAKAEHERNSSLFKLRSTASEFRDIVNEVVATKNTVSTMMDLGKGFGGLFSSKKVSSIQSGSTSKKSEVSSESSKNVAELVKAFNASPRYGKSAGTSKLSKIYNARLRDQTNKRVAQALAQPYKIEKGQLKIANKNAAAVRKTVSRGMGVIERYAAVNMATTVMDTAYRYSTNEKRVTKLVKQLS